MSVEIFFREMTVCLEIEGGKFEREREREESFRLMARSGVGGIVPNMFPTPEFGRNSDTNRFLPLGGKNAHMAADGERGRRR